MRLKSFFHISTPTQSYEQNYSNDRLTFEFMLIQTTTFCYSNLWRVNCECMHCNTQYDGRIKQGWGIWSRTAKLSRQIQQNPKIEAGPFPLLVKSNQL